MHCVTLHHIASCLNPRVRPELEYSAKNQSETRLPVEIAVNQTVLKTFGSDSDEIDMMNEIHENYNQMQPEFEREKMKIHI